jgi:hypothetical protein
MALRTSLYLTRVAENYTQAGNFQAARWDGEDMLIVFEGAHNSLHGHGHGQHTILDRYYGRARTELGIKSQLIMCFLRARGGVMNAL